ncbi:MAG: zinc ribbon domain-containing protein, partial [Nitrospinaceae bacterium]
TLKEGLARIPRQIQAAQTELEGKKARLSQVEGDIAGLKQQRSQLEQDVRELNDQMIKTKQKLPAVKTNKEYSAILAETSGIAEKITQLEDRELEVMEALEEKETHLAPAREEFEGFEKEFTEYKVRKETERTRTESELQEARARGEAMEGDIEPRLLSHYRRVLKHREGLAVAPIKGETCQGCYQQIQPQVALEIKSNGKTLHMCQHCDRYLYFEAEPEPNAESAMTK